MKAHITSNFRPKVGQCTSFLLLRGVDFNYNAALHAMRGATQQTVRPGERAVVRTAVTTPLLGICGHAKTAAPAGVMQESRLYSCESKSRALPPGRTISLAGPLASADRTNRAMCERLGFRLDDLRPFDRPARQRLCPHSTS